MDFHLSLMTIKTREKFDMCWENIDKVNVTLLMAILLDPLHKLTNIRFWYSKINEIEKVDELVRRLTETIKNMIE